MLANTSGSAIGSGTLTLNGGTLAGTTFGGTVSSLVQAGSGSHTIAPGADLPSGQYGILNLNGGLNANTYTTLAFNLNQSTSSGTGGNSEPIYVGDLINLGGSGLSGSGNLAFGGVIPTTGDYRLFTNGNFASLTLANFTLPTFSRPGAYYLSTSVDPGNLDLVVAPTGGATWNISSSGSWNNAQNWSPATVPTSGVVTFAGTANAPITVTLDANQTAGVLAFGDNANPSYTISAGTVDIAATLTLGTPAAAALISVFSGTHTISAPLVLANSADVAPAAGTQLTVSGDVSETPAKSGLSLTLSGPGTLILSGSNSYTGGTDVAAGTLILTIRYRPARRDELDRRCGRGVHLRSVASKRAPDQRRVRVGGSRGGRAGTGNTCPLGSRGGIPAAGSGEGCPQVRAVRTALQHFWPWPSWPAPKFRFAPPTRSTWP